MTEERNSEDLTCWTDKLITYKQDETNWRDQIKKRLT